MSELVRQSVTETVREFDQPPELAALLISWIESAPDPSRDRDEDESFQRVQALFDRLGVGDLDEEEEEANDGN